MKQFFSVKDLPNLPKAVQEALALKKNPFADEALGKHKTLGLVFFNPSLRTRLSTQKAAYNLGMKVLVINTESDGWKLEMQEGAVMDIDKAEHIKDALMVMGQYCDVIGVRTFPTLQDREKDYQEIVLKTCLKYAKVPLISLESSTLHPLQSLADIMTIEETKVVSRPKVVLSWTPHPKALPQAVPNSFAEWAIAANYDFVITHPKGYELPQEFVGNTPVEYDQDKALVGADFVYAKNWSSYHDYGKILYTKRDWTINSAKMELTNNGKLMHCLPIRRNVEVTDEVLDSSQALIQLQAQNRVFAAQWVLKQMIK
jgi:N-succinyl-L-ornithine transcarbamylase